MSTMAERRSKAKKQTAKSNKQSKKGNSVHGIQAQQSKRSISEEEPPIPLSPPKPPPRNPPKQTQPEPIPADPPVPISPPKPPRRASLGLKQQPRPSADAPPVPIPPPGPPPRLTPKPTPPQRGATNPPKSPPALHQQATEQAHPAQPVTFTPETAQPPTQTTPTSRPLLELPHEIVDLILQHTLAHHAPIPVTALFYRHNTRLPPPLDYRILHTSRTLYLTGLRHYYALNTFSISLTLFATAPQTVAPSRWPHGCGLGCAALFVHSVHVSAREFRNWRDAVGLLRGFEALRRVVFDVRDWFGVDEGPEGNMRFDGGWVEVAASEELGLALEGAGVTVGEGGVWVGGETAENAQMAMDRLLVEAIEQGKKDLGL